MCVSLQQAVGNARQCVELVTKENLRFFREWRCGIAVKMLYQLVLRTSFIRRQPRQCLRECIRTQSAATHLRMCRISRLLCQTGSRFCRMIPYQLVVEGPGEVLQVPELVALALHQGRQREEPGMSMTL